MDISLDEKVTKEGKRHKETITNPLQAGGMALLCTNELDKSFSGDKPLQGDSGGIRLAVS